MIQCYSVAPSYFLSLIIKAFYKENISKDLNKLVLLWEGTGTKNPRHHENHRTFKEISRCHHPIWKFYIFCTPVLKYLEDILVKYHLYF